MGQEAFPPLPQAAPAPRPRPPSGLQARPFLNPLAAKGPAKGKDKAAKAPSQVHALRVALHMLEYSTDMEGLFATLASITRCESPQLDKPSQPVA